MVCKWAGISIARGGTIGALVVCFSVLAAACSSSETPAPPRADGGSTSTTDAAARTPDAPAQPSPPDPPNVGEPPDAAVKADGPPAKTCGAIRNCVVACGMDAACAQRCVDNAAAEARTLYQKVAMCSRQYCQPSDINCRCEQECYTDGMCLVEVDGCRDFEQDLFCDELCM